MLRHVTIGQLAFAKRCHFLSSFYQTMACQCYQPILSTSPVSCFRRRSRRRRLLQQMQMHDGGITKRWTFLQTRADEERCYISERVPDAKQAAKTAAWLLARVSSEEQGEGGVQGSCADQPLWGPPAPPSRSRRAVSSQPGPPPPCG